jgi:hypothetical protein
MDQQLRGGNIRCFFGDDSERFAHSAAHAIAFDGRLAKTG